MAICLRAGQIIPACTFIITISRVTLNHKKKKKKKKHTRIAQPCRPSATVIIAAKTITPQKGYDYEILLCKRTPATAYAPNHYVFPGGTFDVNADENSQWLEHFENFGVCTKDLDMLCLQNLKNRPNPLMTNGNNFSRDISLRITAIRETFEEVGVLLCLDKKQALRPKKAWGSCHQDFDRIYWQKKVHNNAKEFLNLCKHLNVIPDLWSLNEWSMWSSPVGSLKRYDTAIYLVAMEEKPQLVLEPSEIEMELWATPHSALKYLKQRTIWLPPLLFYELSRCTHIYNLVKLLHFVQQRQSKGCTLLLLCYYQCNDFLVGTLPGDDFYPDDPNSFTKTIQINYSSKEFNDRSKNIHRLIYMDMYDMLLMSNIPPLDDHLNPVLSNNIGRELSKL